LQNEDIKEKIRQTCIKKYGTECALQQNISECAMEYINKNTQEQLDVDYMQEFIEGRIQFQDIPSDEVKYLIYRKHISNKANKTIYDKYGVDCVFKLEHIKERARKTIFDKYGVDHVAHSPEIIQKRKDTCLKRYGVEHHMQNPDVADRVSKKCYKLRKYILPSGKELNTQGYEYRALDELLKTYKEDDIVMGCKNVPHIHYITEDGKKHIHYVDIWIPSKNLMIEVKSKWTLHKKHDIVMMKKAAAINAGFNYQLWVYDKYEYVEKEIM